MSRLIRRFIRAGSFVGKEISEVRRQPRLVLSLILGPFLILLLFGIGYQGETGRLSATLVLPESGAYSQNIEDYQKLVGEQLTIKSLTTSEEDALGQLRQQEVDIVVKVPTDVAAQISAGSQVLVPVLYNEVDPLRSSWIEYLSYLFINEINKQTVAAAASQGQEEAQDVRQAIARMRNALAAVERHLDQGDTAAASREAESMQQPSSDVYLAVLVMGQLLGSGSPLIGPAQAQNPEQVNLAEGQRVSRDLSANVQLLSEDLDEPNPDPQRVRQRLARVRADLDTLDRLTQQFQTINPLVLAAPFYPQVENRAPVAANVTAFYAPGVVALLLQHIAVTLAALSMVRERLLGTMELFRVSPVSPSEILAGKYVSFMLLLGVVAVVLLFMLTNDLSFAGFQLSLGVPMLGNWGMLALTLVLVVFASIGLGFFISAISRSESQAVQLSMLVLLTSVFFSGFFLRLETLWPPVRAVAYLLPVTYGLSESQVIMLRGGTPDALLLLAVLALGLLFGLLGFILLRREFSKG